MLMIVQEHESTGTAALLDDTVIGERLGLELLIIQRQLDLLEAEGHVELFKTFGLRYAVRMTPNGFAAIEAIAAQSGKSPARRIGF